MLAFGLVKKLFPHRIKNKAKDFLRRITLVDQLDARVARLEATVSRSELRLDTVERELREGLADVKAQVQVTLEYWESRTDNIYQNVVTRLSKTG